MKKIFVLLLALIMLISFAACGEGSTSSADGGSSDLPNSSETASGTESETESTPTSSDQTKPVSYSGEYTRVVKYLNEDMKLVINGNTATFTTARKQLLAVNAFVVEKTINIHKGNITIDENGYVVLTTKELFDQLEILGTAENINYYRNEKLAEQKEWLDKNYLTEDECNEKCEYYKGNPVKQSFTKNSWTFKLDNESRKLYVIKTENDGYIEAYEYREDGTLKYSVTDTSDGRHIPTEHDKYGHPISNGITREFYPSGAIKAEIYSNGAREEYNEDGRRTLYAEGNGIGTYIYGSDYRLLKEITKIYEGGKLDYHMVTEYLDYNTTKSTTYYPSTGTPQEIFWKIKDQPNKREEYYENGNLKRRTIYDENDKIIGYEDYDEQGNLIE